MTPTADQSATATSTPTPAPEGAVFKITKSEAYPVPFNPNRDTRLFVDFALTQSAKKITFTLYTTGYRRILEKEIPAAAAGSHSVSLELPELKSLSNGAYYWVITAESEKGERGVGRANTLIILK